MTGSARRASHATLSAWTAALMLAGCASTGGRVVQPEPSAGASPNTPPAVAPAPPPGRGSTTTVPPSVPAPKSTSVPPNKTSPIVDAPKNAKIAIRPDRQCATPDENYDILAAMQQRVGAEGALRLKQLVSTDFKGGKLSKQDHELLRKMSKEMLWIPAPLEEAIGTAFYQYSKSNLKELDNNEATAPIWSHAERTTAKLLGNAPKMPFQTVLVLLNKGDPQALAGGRIFLDSQTIEGAVDDPNDRKQVDKTTFVLAHELAHVYKRHRAKRIQQLLVDSDSGLQLVRTIFTALQPKDKKAGTNTAANQEPGWGAYLKTAMLVPSLVDEFNKHNAAYLQDQEMEADACAAALMLSSGLGDPVAGFVQYRQDEKAKGHTQEHIDLYASHPPNAQRETNIRQRTGEIRGAPAKGGQAKNERQATAR